MYTIHTHQTYLNIFATELAAAVAWLDILPGLDTFFGHASLVNHMDGVGH